MPLVAFWYFAEASTQAFYHGVLGGLSRLITKTFIDKDIEGLYKKDNVTPMTSVPSPAY